MSMIISPFRFAVAGGGPVTANRWRVYVVQNQSGGSVPAISCAELEMRATAGGADITTGGTPIADSIFSGSFPATNAFDGNGSTFWVSLNTAGTYGTHWLGYVFTSDVEVREVSWSKRPDTFGQNEAPTFGSVQYSTDGGTTWQTYWVFTTGATWGTGAETRVFTKPASDLKRFWRLRVTETQTTNQYHGSHKIEFREAAGGADQATGGTAIGVAPFNGSTVAANAFDANNTTNWLSGVLVAGGNTVWIGYDFGSGVGKEILEVLVGNRTGGGGAANSSATAVTVEWSLDSVNWVTSWSFTTPATWSDSTAETRVFTKP